jgi:hypothetical protein
MRSIPTIVKDTPPPPKGLTRVLLRYSRSNIVLVDIPDAMATTKLRETLALFLAKHKIEDPAKAGIHVLEFPIPKDHKNAYVPSKTPVLKYEGA